MPVEYETIKVTLGPTHKRKLREAMGKMKPVTLKLSKKHLTSGSDSLVVTHTMKERIEKKTAQNLGTTLKMTQALLKANKSQSGGWLNTALTIVPLAQEALKDDSTNKLLTRLDRLREQDGDGVQDWKDVGDAAKFVFTNPAEGIELLARETKNLLTGNFKNSEKKYRLPKGVDYKPGMDFKKIGTEIKGSGITFY